MRVLALVLNAILLPVSTAMSFVPFSTAQGRPYPISYYILLVVPISALLNVVSLLASPRRFLALHQGAIGVSSFVALGFTLLWLWIVIFGNSFGRSQMLRQAPAFICVVALFAVSAIAVRRRQVAPHG